MIAFIRNENTEFDLTDPIDISIALDFNGPQPNAYGVDPATSIPCRYGDLVGDTREGGSCNFEQYTFIPHCNGTHTECIGHITNERISIRECLREAIMTARLITIEPEVAERTTESYSMPMAADDSVITRRSLETLARDNVDALVIRTMPNDDTKRTRKYLDTVPPYFTTEAMLYIVELSIKHLLVDLPSIDRLYDEGRLSNHRTFWNVEQGSFEATEGSRLESTVTEFVYIPDEVPDGRYLLNLQIAPFASDASPSRPLLFRVNEN